jgi:hydroxyacylglutathione hydrolase
MILETFAVGPLRCNCTIVGDESTKEAMVVDPGGNVREIMERLERHGLAVKQIVITHGHIDHVAGAAELKRRTGAPVFLNERDVPLLRAMDVQAGWIGVATPEAVELDGSAEEGAVLGLTGLKAEVLHTPGHTPGSICLLFPEGQLLLAGDTLFAGSIGRTDLPGGDTEAILRSLHQRLAPLPEETRVIPGHGAETTIGQERETNPFLQARFRR